MADDIRVLDAEADRTHEANGDAGFQETSLIVWQDMTSGVGGVWSLSQTPAQKLTHSCFAVFSTEPGANFRHSVQGARIQAADRGPSHMGLGSNLRLDLADVSILADLPECQADLVFTDFHARFDYRHLMNISETAGYGSQHTEVSGSVKGTMRIGGRKFKVDALGHRSRSWGPRYWHTLLSTRWWPMVFGPDLSMHFRSSVSRTGTLRRTGYVIRNGVPSRMSESGLAITLDYDSVGPKAGRIQFRTEEGDAYELNHQRAADVFVDTSGLLAIESIGRVSFGNRIGMSNIEICANPFGGEGIPGVDSNPDALS